MRLCAVQWANRLYPLSHVVARYICVLAAGDTKLEVRTLGEGGEEAGGGGIGGRPGIGGSLLAVVCSSLFHPALPLPLSPPLPPQVREEGLRGLRLSPIGGGGGSAQPPKAAPLTDAGGGSSGDASTAAAAAAAALEYPELRDMLKHLRGCTPG